MNSRIFTGFAALGALLLTACDGQQYVSPETVHLVIKKEGATMERVNRCNYMPVLLGSSVVARYVVDDDLKATLSITRDSVTVSFDDAADTFKVSATELNEGAQTAPNPPSGYVVDLSTGCVPDDD